MAALPVSIAAVSGFHPGMPTPHVTRLRLAHMAGKGILASPSSLLPIVRFAATAPGPASAKAGEIRRRNLAATMTWRSR